jgi:CHAT domain-containing protein/Tfp pilus assembly protein PilF
MGILASEMSDFLRSMNRYRLHFQGMKNLASKWLFGVTVVGGLAMTAHADDAQVAAHLVESYGQHFAAGRYAEAEADARQLEAWAKTTHPPQPGVLAEVRGSLVAVWKAQGRFSEAEQKLKSCLADQERVEPVGNAVGLYLDHLGYLYQDQARYVEAEAVFRRALTVWEKILPAKSDLMAWAWRNLGNSYSAQGRHAEAELLYKHALQIHQALASDNLQVANTYSALANLYTNQGRFAEAENLRKLSLTIYERDLPRDGPDFGRVLNDTAWTFALDGRYAEAEPLVRRSLAVLEECSTDELAPAAPILDTLAMICFKTGRFDEAELHWKRALRIFEAQWPQGHPDGAEILNNYAALLVQQNRHAEAEPLADRAIAIGERCRTRAWLRFASYSVRAVISWRLGQRNDAVADLERAMDLAEQARGQSGGAEQERAGNFAQFAGAFEQMVAWQVELGDAGKALGAIERSRARSLLDEMNLGGADLQVGLPATEREQLQRHEGELKSRIAQLEARLAAAHSATKAGAKVAEPVERLEADLAEARQALYDHSRDQRSTSPVYRNLLSVGTGSPRMSQLQRKLLGDDGLLLAYLLGDEGGYVVAIGPGSAGVTALTVDARAAKILGVEPGPLTAARLRAICANERHEGVVEQLARPATASAVTAQLAALWTVLVPPPQRQALTGGKIKKLIVVPDGPLALLAFETLVVEPGGKSPKFLLDVGPPILYAPSATVLYNLSERRAGKGAADQAAQPVLTVANPVYGAKRTAAPAGALDSLAARSRYGASGGVLAALPYSGDESSWVADVYKKQGIASAGLLAGLATEANVRFNVPGRRVLHFACHGLTDQAYGNFFGCLALTPGKQGAANPADDGFLTLPEIYELNLKGCELAILSACETNYGPQQKGEGVWALSRGFLVAGARRVVASNWLVDDEAAASLISYFCGGIAKGEAKGETADHAKALHDSKRWVRQQEKWASPYYWGTFVLVGPN